MKRKLLLLVGILLVISLACSALSLRNRDEPTAEPDTEVTAEAVGGAEDGQTTDEAEPVESPEASDVDESGDAFAYDSQGLDELDSYRATLSYEVTKADETVEAFSFEQTATREPAAQHLIMSSSDGDVEYIQIDDQMWVRFGEDWMQGSSDALGSDDFGSILSSSNDWVTEVDSEDYEYLGKETINGIRTKHYRVPYAAGWAGMLDLGNTTSEYESGAADIWIANDPGLPEFVVRYYIEATGTADGVESSFTLTLEVTEINEDVVIEAPEGVALGGLPEGVPVYPGASELSSFAGMTTFTVPDDLTTVNDFYTEALTDAGWEVSGEGFDMETMSSSTWIKDGDELSFTVTADDDGVVTVLVMVTDGE